MTKNKQKKGPDTTPTKAPPSEVSGFSLWTDRIVLFIVLLIFLLCPFALSSQLYDPKLSQTIILQTTLAFLAAVYLPIKIFGSRQSISFNFLDILVLLYLGVHYLSAITGPSPLASLGETAFLTGFVGLYLILRLNRLSKKALPWLFSALILSATACALYGTLQRFGIEFVEYEETNRRGKLLVTSFLGNPNYLGSLLAPLVIISFGLCLYFKQVSLRIICFICFIALCTGLIASGCRSAWVGAFVGTIISGTIYIISLRKKTTHPNQPRRLFLPITAGICIVIAIIAGLFLGNFQLTQRLFSIGEINSRLMFWQLGLSFFLDHPILGVAPGQLFSQVNDAIYHLFTETPDGFIYEHYLRGTWTGLPDHLHNEYFQHLAETGFLGLWFFTTIIWSATKTLLPNNETPQQTPSIMKIFLVGGLFTLLIDGLWGFPLQLPCSALVFWTILAIAGNFQTKIPRKPNKNWMIYITAAACLVIFTASGGYSVKKWQSITTRVQAFRDPSILHSYKMNIEELDAAFWVAPMEDPPPNALIDAYVESKNWQRAKKSITAIMKYYNTGSSGYQQLGWVNYKLKNFKEAKKNFHHACVLEPDNNDSRELLAYISLRLGDYTESRNQALNLIDSNPERPNAYYILGALGKALGDSKAQQHYYQLAFIANSNYNGTLLFNPDDLK